MSHATPDIPFNEAQIRQASSELAAFVQAHPKLLVLTGAGVSTDSGIPDYRDDKGDWKRRPPIQHKSFMVDADVRQRYWARSLLGWPVIRNARPNVAHQALAEMERQGSVARLVTQNVDRLHQRAGSCRVTDLHGRADRVLCMECGYYCTRDEVHDRCAEMNPDFLSLSAKPAPDGDADLDRHTGDFRVADCPACGGILKPDVVFFGDFVPGDRVSGALEALRCSDGLLAIGSSLMVYSGFRFCRYAREWAKPIATLTLGRTRADDMTHLRLQTPIGPTLAGTLHRLSR